MSIMLSLSCYSNSWPPHKCVYWSIVLWSTGKARVIYTQYKWFIKSKIGQHQLMVPRIHDINKCVPLLIQFKSHPWVRTVAPHSMTIQLYLKYDSTYTGCCVPWRYWGRQLYGFHGFWCSCADLFRYYHFVPIVNFTVTCILCICEFLYSRMSTI